MSAPVLRRGYGWLRFGLGVIWATFAFLPGRSWAAQTSEYRGFTIDESGVGKLENLEQVRVAIREQIDIVWAVELPEEILEFVQRVPFQRVVAGARANSSPGVYSARTKEVEGTSRIVTIGHKPVLLHAHHDQRIKGGYGNREILSFYAEDQRLSGFARTSHML